MQSVDASFKVALETLVQAACGGGHAAALPAGSPALGSTEEPGHGAGGPWDCCSVPKAEGKGWGWLRIKN